jgi:hypothetical protein
MLLQNVFYHIPLTVEILLTELTSVLLSNLYLQTVPFAELYFVLLNIVQFWILPLPRPIFQTLQCLTHILFNELNTSTPFR